MPAGNGGKEVSIGEGSAAASGFNADEEGVHFSKDPGILDPMQQYVFDQLGYTEMAKSLGIPLINLHTGEMVEVDVPDAFVYNKIVLHKSLSEIDMLCSVPMMKTHVLARVTLGMKNKAIEADPDYALAYAGKATAHQYYAEHLACLGKNDMARMHIDRAVELDPLSFVKRYRSARMENWYSQNKGVGKRFLFIPLPLNGPWQAWMKRLLTGWKRP